jgi:acyl carrier protein
MDTAATVKRLIVDHLCVEPEKVTDDAMLVDDLGADSLDAVELAMACDEEFGIALDDDEIKPHFRVCDLVGLVEGQIKKGK